MDERFTWTDADITIEDAEVKPDVERMAPHYERRSVELAEFRVEMDGQAPRIRGHAAVFSTPTEIMTPFGAYVEEIAPGAFTKTLKEADVRALFNHNPDYVLGRNRAGTLALREDARGLAVEISPPDAQWARDLMGSMQRGDITQMSFGFMPVKDKSDWATPEGQTPRVVRREVKLFDVSIATFGAYPQTDAYVRSAITALERYLVPPEPVQRDHSETSRREPPSDGHSLADAGSREAPLPESRSVPKPEPATDARHSLRVDWSRLEKLEALIAKERTHDPGGDDRPT